MSTTHQKTPNTVYESASKLLQTLTPQETYAAIVSEAMKLTNAQYGTIFLEENASLERVYASDPRLYDIEIRSRGNTYNAFKENKPYILTSQELHDIHPEFEGLETESDLSVPLSYNNHTIGVLCVISEKGRVLTQDDLQTLLYYSPIATLAISNVLAYQKIQKTLEERDLFISMAAHELKTPLTSTMLYSQILEKKLIEKKLTDEMKFTKNLNASLKRLQSLINELLLMSQIKTGGLRFEKRKMNLSSLVSKIISESQDRYTESTIQFVQKGEKDARYIFADGSKIAQVLHNLINNAVKYSPKKSIVDVTLLSEDSWHTIIVKDQGKGIEKKELPHIFDRFYRGSTSQNQGLGLGLYIVKIIIDEHGGKILVNSTLNSGTTFTLKLPRVE